MTARAWWSMFAACALFFMTGCGGGGLTLTPIKSTQSKPSNVAIYFKVQTSGGDPVGGLTADSFRIYEDDELVSQLESKQTILNPEVAASHTVLDRDVARIGLSIDFGSPIPHIDGRKLRKRDTLPGGR